MGFRVIILNMDVDQLPPPVWVSTPSALRSLANELQSNSLVAVDTESNSLHAYRERVCLIQFSTAQNDFVVDPLAIKDLSPLAPLFANAQIEKIFHAAEYDLICLRRDYSWTFNAVFDTMVAARTLGWQQMGLASILESEYGVKLNKRHQRANWGKRPLTADQLSYARLDTHFLISLRNKLAAELKAKACWDEALEEFERLTHLNGAAASDFDPSSFWRVSGARLLTARQAAVLRELYVYREQVAMRLDRPPFKVMGEQTLLAMARQQPKSLQDLAAIAGMSDGQVRRHGAAVLQAVERGLSAPGQHPSAHEPRDEAVIERFDKLRRWRKQRAQERGVESDVIMPRDVLWELARRVPKTTDDLEHVAGFGPVRRKKYGEDILSVLHSTPNSDSS